jgi:hypothetical protein
MSISLLSEFQVSLPVSPFGLPVTRRHKFQDRPYPTASNTSATMTRLSPTPYNGAKAPVRPSVSSLLTASLLEQHSQHNRRMSGIDASAAAAVSAALAATAAVSGAGVAPNSPRMQLRGDAALSLGSILEQALSYAREERERNYHDEDQSESEASAGQQ